MFKKILSLFLLCQTGFAQVNYPDFIRGWESSVPTVGALPSVGNLLGDARVVTGSSTIYLWNGSSWVAVSGGGGGGISSLNGLSGASQTFATGTTGTDFGIVSSGTTHTFNIPSSSGSNRGLLSSADWTTFNGKVSTSRLINTTAPLTGGGDLSADRTIAIPAATSSVNGYLTSADWTTFNGKQAAGSYITALTGDVTASGPGSVAATIAALAVTNAKIANSTIDLTAKVTGLLPLANLASLQVNKYLYVDGARTDSYTADGSSFRPFITIGAAISQIITNADNASKAYTVIVQPGNYNEALTFNNALLYSISFFAPGGATFGTNTVAITSTSNNTQLGTLSFNGFTINGGMTLTGDTNATNMCSSQCIFTNVAWNTSTNGINLTNTNNVSFYGGQVQGSTTHTWQNVAFAYVQGAEGIKSGTTLALVNNNGANQPSQNAGGNYFLSSESKMGGTITIDAGSEMDDIQTYFSSTSSISNSGTFHSFKGSFNGSFAMNSGSANRFRDDSFLNAPTGTGAITNQSENHVARMIVGTSAQSVTNGLLVLKDGHVVSNRTTAPVATVNANAGTGATCSVSNASDMAGTINLTTTAVSPASGAQCSIAFNAAYNVAPICVLTPTNANAALFSVINGEYFTTSTSALVVNYQNADATGHANTWAYHCIETQ